MRSRTSDTGTNRFLEIRDLLNQVSPSFCLAKWLQVTLHLHNGTNHSCHHPVVHPIPLEEIEKNPAALHNTPFKKEQQRLMKQGVRPSECNYCWTIEDLGSDQVSDRYMKSGARWAAPFFTEVRNLPNGADILPSAVEVSFSRSCNFKCSYCSPSVSTRWAQEIKQFGSYREGPEYQNLDEPFEEEQNPYVRAFWRWWPELKKSLKIFRITGGEPLLSPSTFRVLEELCDEPNPELHLAVNSNLGAPDSKIERLLSVGSALTESKKIASLTIFTSLEAWGSRAEYVRHGLELGRFWSNLEKLLDGIPGVEVVFMSTYNALGMSTFTEFLKKVIELRQRRGTENPKIDISYLRFPDYQAANIMTDDFYTYADESLGFMEQNRREPSRPWGFSEWEIVKMRRICEWIRQPSDPAKLRDLRGRFRSFFTEHDRRRGTDFLATFPEYAEFWRNA